LPSAEKLEFVALALGISMSTFGGWLEPGSSAQLVG
jgi:hypothetical protein